MDTKHYQNQTLVEVAYKALKRDIAERAFLPGQKLITRELHERYGISETPIKLALNRLITEGLIESIPRRGFSVKNIDWEDIDELLDVRKMLETYYSSQILDNFQKDIHMQRQFLENITEHKRIVEHGVDINDYFQVYSLDYEFHQMFIRCAGNKRIAQVYDNLGTHVYAYYIYGKQSKEATIDGVREHEDIYEALVARDEVRLQQCVEMHLENAKVKIRNVLKNE
ncbi:MAG: transcriptional regulator GntR family [Bacillota bacterium]|nr:MAG: transcriptional regulator GntR family [Bacillota bacterium]MBS3949299.1 GntR family transcriptional regulator [Peptococcaceae bacterium]